MSAADQQNQTPLGLSSEAEVTGLIQRLAALLQSDPEFRDLVNVPLDSMLTTKQTCKWLQIDRKNLHEKVREELIPAVPMSDSTFRFHPRTILSLQTGLPKDHYLKHEPRH